MVGAEPVRWFERVSWWEAERRMPLGLSRVDVEVWRVQTRLGRNAGSALTTMELSGTDLAADGGCGALWQTTVARTTVWRTRPDDDRAQIRPAILKAPNPKSPWNWISLPPRLLGDAAVEGLQLNIP